MRVLVSVRSGKTASRSLRRSPEGDGLELVLQTASVPLRSHSAPPSHPPLPNVVRKRGIIGGIPYADPLAIDIEPVPADRPAAWARVPLAQARRASRWSPRVAGGSRLLPVINLIPER